MRSALNSGWEFRRLEQTASSWEQVELPHTPFVADLDGRDHWFGECEYRRSLVAVLSPGDRCLLHVGAAMHTCAVIVGSREIMRHYGGFLPFEVDLTEELDATGRCTVTLRLDNRDNPDVPPGKPYADLDFCWYGGLYRGVELHVRPPVHFTSAIAAGDVAGGGIFVRTLSADAGRAEILARSHIYNNSPVAQNIRVRTEFQFQGRLFAKTTSETLVLAPFSGGHDETRFELSSPALWSPTTPHLYDVTVTLLDGTEATLDTQTLRYGIRRIAFSRSTGFTMNGVQLRFRGTNRHQEFPRVGYAAPRCAQYRDARRIKEAGFDYVRLSHYPQSTHFLDACDELGIVVMNCLPGWQYFGGERFRSAAYSDARQMIRRDRNRACIVLWELSLNETAMDDEFMARLHAIGHEEFPGDQMYTCGWIDRYDVFSHSRQHGQMHRWRNGDKALVIAEYGDWEFYARNEGFDQKTGAGVYDAWSTTRQFRGDGERGLSRQVLNHIIALNDTLASPAVFDGQWAMFDYARGYDPVRAAVGVMDIFRLPKFSYYFYRSQRGPEEGGAGWIGGPTIFIASHWTEASSLQVLVFSNCDEVELRLNGHAVSRARPARTALAQHLPHPPFRFDLDRFEAGTLDAVGYLGDLAVANHVVRTPSPSSRLEIIVDDLALRPPAGEMDVLFVHARLLDSAGTLCVQESVPIEFAVAGAELVGPALIVPEAGIASIVLRVPAGAEGFAVTAHVPTRADILRVSHKWSGAKCQTAIPI